MALRRYRGMANESGGGRQDYPEPLNRLDYADNPGEFELQQEIRRIGVRNTMEPSCCPTCHGELDTQGGMVGERILVCPVDGIVWEDSEDAIRRVY